MIEFPSTISEISNYSTTCPHLQPMIDKNTETEILESQHLNLFIIDKLINQGVFTMAEIGEYIPAFFHLNNEHDLSIEYMNQTGCEWLQLTSGEINAMGYDFLEKYLHPDTLKYVAPPILNFYQKGDRSKVYCDFQQVMDLRNRQYKLLFTVTKIFNKRPGLLTISLPVDSSIPMIKKLERVLGEQAFARSHFKQFSALTKREVQILVLLATGHSNPQIADQLFVSRHTVEQHRKNINRKLDIKHFADVMKYAQAFDLI